MRLQTCAVFVLLVSSLTLQGDPLYRITANLGYYTQGSALNNAGQVTGNANTADGSYHAFLYTNGQMTDLGTFGGSDSYGAGINDAGQVTGGARTTYGDEHAFLYSNGQMIDLSTLLGGAYSSGTGINNAGQVVGSYIASTNQYHAFLYSNGQMNDLCQYRLNREPRLRRKRVPFLVFLGAWRIATGSSITAILPAF